MWDLARHTTRDEQSGPGPTDRAHRVRVWIQVRVRVPFYPAGSTHSDQKRLVPLMSAYNLKIISTNTVKIIYSLVFFLVDDQWNIDKVIYFGFYLEFEIRRLGLKSYC
jgi:hypothetical protein